MERMEEDEVESPKADNLGIARGELFGKLVKGLAQKLQFCCGHKMHQLGCQISSFVSLPFLLIHYFLIFFI